jgi:predicted secreted protein
MTHRTTRVVVLQASAVESRLELSATTGDEEPVAAQVEEEVPAETGLVDIASILGAPTVTIVRSSL